MPKKFVRFIIVFCILLFVAIIITVVNNGKKNVWKKLIKQNIKVEDITKLTMQRPEQKPYSFVRDEKNDWVVFETTNSIKSAPLDNDKINNLVQKFFNIQVGEVISKDKGKHDTFWVTPEKGVGVRLFSSDKPVMSIIVGKTGSSYLTCYIRNENKDKVFLSKGIRKYEVGMNEEYWVKKKPEGKK